MIQKTTLLLLFILGSNVLFAQNQDITIAIDDFKEIKVFDGLSVNLIKSTENKAVVTGENTQNVSIVNNEGILKIRMQLTKIFSGYRTFVDVYYSGEIAIIDVNEDARISSEISMKQEILELKAQEGGELLIYAEVKQLLIKTVTGGVIETHGVADLQDVAINTGGIYEGRECLTKFTTVNVNAGSKAEIYATDYVKASVKAGGEVLVYGNPNKLEEKTIFGGKVTKVEK